MPSYSQVDLVTKYFSAWQHHDSALLRSIMAGDIQYERSGKSPILGIEALESYWKRNSDRQEDLIVYPSISEVRQDAIEAMFVAQFFSSKEKDFQTVFGTIRFFFDPAQPGRIIRIWEKYAVKRGRVPGRTLRKDRVPVRGVAAVGNWPAAATAASRA